MKTLFDFGELGTFNFQTEERVKYIASFLWWKEFIEKVIQIKWEPQEVTLDDGSTTTVIPTYPEIQQIPNEVGADVFIIETAKKHLADIAKNAFMQLKKEELAKIEEQIQLELENEIKASIQ